MISVASFDPGETTGFVAARVWDVGSNFEIEHTCEVEWDDRIRKFFDLVFVYQPVLVLIESFKLYAGMGGTMTGSEFRPIQAIGNIQVACWRHSLENSIIYIPAGVKGSIALLDEHKEFLKPSSSQHVFDAYRILRYWAIMRGKRSDWRME